jgi:hypothetical protein
VSKVVSNVRDDDERLTDVDEDEYENGESPDEDEDEFADEDLMVEDEVVFEDNELTYEDDDSPDEDKHESDNHMSGEERILRDNPLKRHDVEIRHGSIADEMRSEQQNETDGFRK